MFTLILMRHAKAVKSAGEDFARDLTTDGRDDALRAGATLHGRALRPDLAMVSPAARTRQTFEAVRAAWADAIDAGFADALYDATGQAVRDLVGTIDPGVRTLMVVGHNPGIAEGVAALARDGDLRTIDRLRSGFPPCTLAVLTFEAADWREATRAGGHLAHVLTLDDFAA